MNHRGNTVDAEGHCENPFCECQPTFDATPSSRESWEEEFDRDFTTQEIDDWRRMKAINADIVKRFIRKELDASYTEGYEKGGDSIRYHRESFEKGRAEGKSLCLKEVREKVEALKFHSGLETPELREAAEIGWVRALFDVLTALKEMEEQKHEAIR